MGRESPAPGIPSRCSSLHRAAVALECASHLASQVFVRRGITSQEPLGVGWLRLEGAASTLPAPCTLPSETDGRRVHCLIAVPWQENPQPSGAADNKAPQKVHLTAELRIKVSYTTACMLCVLCTVTQWL